MPNSKAASNDKKPKVCLCTPPFGNNGLGCDKSVPAKLRFTRIVATKLNNDARISGVTGAKQITVHGRTRRASLGDAAIPTADSKLANAVNFVVLRM